MSDTEDAPDSPFREAEALALVASFFDHEWPAARIEGVELRTITGGLINRLYLLTRHNKALTEPSAVLIRHFGTDGSREQQPLESNTTLSAAEQAIIYMEMGRRGWGPQIYGIFAGGRLEEWIDAHPLTAKESMQPHISRDIARSFARLHSLRPPFRKDNFELVVAEMCDGYMRNSALVVETLTKLEEPSAIDCAKVFNETRWNEELIWTSSLFKRHSCRATLMHGDTNYLNVLVKNQVSDCMVSLIDFETTTYGYRGIDIGGHFLERMYNWSLPENKLTGFDVPDEEEQRSFCASYLQEMRTLGQTLAPSDSVEHLMLEAKIGRLHQLVSVTLMMLVLDEVEEDPFFLQGLTHMMRSYHELKEEFEHEKQL